jgi:hypothetical protein
MVKNAMQQMLELIETVKQKMLGLQDEDPADLSVRGYVIYSDIKKEAICLNEEFGYGEDAWIDVLGKVSVHFKDEYIYDIHLVLGVMLAKYKHKQEV